MHHEHSDTPEIDKITDTLGRLIEFHYDASNVLTAITAPGLGSGRRTLIRLHYATRPLEYNFAPSLRVRGVSGRSPISVIDAIYYPGSSTGYWFGYADSFSPYGMIRKVEEQRGMVFSAASLNEQGTVSPGSYTRRKTYDYPHDLSHPPLTDAPAYRTMTEDRVYTPSAQTSYSVWQEVSPRRVEMTHPDGTRTVQLSFYAAGNIRWKDGLVYQIDTYNSSTGQLLQRTALEWEGGLYVSPRVKSKVVTDERGQAGKTEFAYGDYNQVVEVREYDYGGALLRRTHTDYEPSSNLNYINRHILNLPKAVQVYEGAATVPVSRTEFSYDGQSLADTPGVIQHSNAYNPYAPEICEEVCYRVCDDTIPPRCYQECETRCVNQYDPATDYRGNITQIKRYAAGDHPAGAITEMRRYDINGNPISVSTSPNEQTSNRYTLETQYAYPVETTREAPEQNSPARITTRAGYDLNTSLVLSTADANGRTTQINYFAATLRPQTVTSSTGARTTYAYDDTALNITSTTRDASGTIAEQRVRQLNGLGLVRREQTLAVGSQWDSIETQHNAMGRVVKQTLPYRSGQSPQWTEWSYDKLGRVTELRMPDGTKVLSYYNEATRPTGALPDPGQTVRMVDPWGRERWSRIDALGRLRELVEPNPQGSGSVFAPGHFVTRYNYNGLGQIVQVDQGSQRRRFRYDSLGRLTHQHLPEKLATLNDQGAYVGANNWSDFFTYDHHSNLTSHTDARGVKTIYGYGNDPLRRLQSVIYDRTGVGDTASPVLPAPDVTFQYMTTGDVTRLSGVTTSGISTEVYAYDAEGRFSSKKLTMMSRSGSPLVIDYAYDSLSRVTDIRYPAQYGITGTPRKLVHFDYGLANRVRGLKADGAEYASQIAYNAAGQLVSLTVGGSSPNPLTEGYTYAPITGLLTRQQVHVLGEGGQVAAPVARQVPATVGRAEVPRTAVLDLEYDYLRTGTSQARTGQLTRMINNLNGQKSRAFEYDALGRLRKASGGPPSSPLWAQEYRYDEFGNRTSVTASGNAANGTPIPRDGLATLSYDTSRNRIATAGFTYDAAGNLTRGMRADGVWQRYQYDAAGRLVNVLADAGGAPLEAYTYGAAGRQRLITQKGNQISRTYHVWSGDAVIAEYSDTSANILQWNQSYVYLGSRLLASLTNGGQGEVVQYHHPDRIGTRLVSNHADTTVQEQADRLGTRLARSHRRSRTTVLPDPADTTVQEQVTLPFGVFLEAESAGSTNPIFTSYDRSATTGLDYAVNRFYHPHLGRFMQVDPVGMGVTTLGKPQSLNLYTYVQDDPVNRIDPLGLVDRPCTDIDTSGCLSEDITVIAPPPAPPPPPDLSWPVSTGPRDQPGGERPGRGGGRPLCPPPLVNVEMASPMSPPPIVVIGSGTTEGGYTATSLGEWVDVGLAGGAYVGSVVGIIALGSNPAGWVLAGVLIGHTIFSAALISETVEAIEASSQGSPGEPAPLPPPSEPNCPL